MNAEKINDAVERLLEARQLLLDAGVAPNGRFVREIEELSSDLELFARFAEDRAA